MYVYINEYETCFKMVIQFKGRKKLLAYKEPTVLTKTYVFKNY